jgi:dTDP-4-amino-4,6-dideoxygalactose transaminase
MDIQAAMGIHQLGRVDAYWERRKQIWDLYNREFADLPCNLPKQPEKNTKHAYHLYTPLIDCDRLGKSRDWVLNAITAENIGVGVHYLPVHEHPYYRKTFKWEMGDYPNAESIGFRTLSLPLSAALTDEDVNDVISAFRKVMSQ